MNVVVDQSYQDLIDFLLADYKMPEDVMGEIGTLYEDSPHLKNDGTWQFIYMYFLGLIIGGGTSQIQKNIIAERGLGMPKEPKIQGA